jgi:hypothetical protein
MKSSIRNAVVIVSIGALLAVLSTRVMAVAGAGGEWQPVPTWQGSTLYQVEHHRVPSQYDPVLLVLGRAVYADLQRARQAALDRKLTNLRVAIREAGETVGRLKGPAEATPLHEQLEIIRNDLRDTSKRLDRELWVPVEAEIDDVLVYVPEDVKARAHEAIHKAREAAAQGDRKRVAEQFDVVTSTLEYSLGVFPLRKIGADLASAQASASLSPPDWTGALEAVQSALASFHWYTQVPADGLLSAYNTVINAYVLAAGPLIRDDQHWEIIDYLTRAKHELDGIPDGKALVDEAGKLIDAGEPLAGDIKTLLGHIQDRMRAEQRKAEVRYWQTIGPDTPE